MDLSDLSSTATPVKPGTEQLPLPTESEDRGSYELANQIAAEVASSLTPALDGVRNMQATGRIDRAGLQSLMDCIEQARHAALLGQQVVRLAREDVQQQPEAINLADALRDV